MKLLIILPVLVVAASAALQTYSAPEAGQDGHSGGVPLPSIIGHSTAAGHSAGAGHSAAAGHSASAGHASGAGHTAGVGFAAACKEGDVLHVDGTCVTPEINRKLYVFDVPEQPREPSGPTPVIPPPRVDHNILFVRLPEDAPGPEPLVLPPPRTENIVYVLNKKNEVGQRVIEVPAHPQSNPEVYFVNYEDGENPALPIGVDLETALSAAAATSGQVLGGAGGFGGAAGAAGGLGGFGGAAGAAGGLGGFGGAGVAAGSPGGFGGASGATGSHGGLGGGTGAAGGFGGSVGAAGGLGGSHGGLGGVVEAAGGSLVSGGFDDDDSHEIISGVLAASPIIASTPSGVYGTP
ncbi:ATP-dependent RNA helicase A-like isoform X2 [Penaeus monodon]|uniref:ATP-dependent RNA helicase A-like isoform X2 n=1 Tax=Penaeus monodon TaxID=6687 RepID=UPI0018A7B70F|nr:ATP-dependent RNA helicase A-like isoform X2 [Penaeus monodon]